MAQRVVRSTGPSPNKVLQPDEKEKIQPKPLAESVTPFLQRQIEGEEIDEEVTSLPEETPPQAKSDRHLKDTKDPLQDEKEKAAREVSHQARGLDADPVQALAAIGPQLRAYRGLGSPLPDTVRRSMERGFGADFSGVRVHAGAKAAEMADGVRAQAFTRRNDIYFNEGRYNPVTTEGKLLLAHELTHSIQQGAVRLLPAKPEAQSERARTEAAQTEEAAAQSAADIIEDMRYRRNERLKRSGAPDNREAPPRAEQKLTRAGAAPDAAPETAAETEEAAPAAASKGKTAPAPAAVPEGAEPGAPAIPKAPASPKEDKAFQSAKRRVKFSAKEQKSLESKELKTAASAMDAALLKRAETEDASAMDAASQKDQDAKTKRTGELESAGETQKKTYKFDAATFKGLLLDKIKEILPDNEDQAKAFPKSGKLEGVKSSVSETVAKEKQNAVGPVDKKISENLPAGEAQKPDNIPIPSPKPAAAAPRIDPKQAAPKPKTDQEISLQHESDKLDDMMTKNRLTEDQLANSNEPKFVHALEFKKETQQRIAETPGVYREQEQAILAEAQRQAGKELQSDLGAMRKTKHSTVNKVFGSQGKTETETEKRQRIIKATIDGIYNQTVIDVEAILKNLAESVQTGFAEKLEKMTALFSESVRSRLEEYYGDYRIDDELFGPVAIVKDPETGKVMLINPDVWAIFKEEKDWYLEAMGRILDDTSRTVAEGLTAAWERIQKGRKDQDDFKKTLKGDELAYADTLTKEVNLKFEALESSIEDTQNELLESLSEQYAENVNNLKKTFNEINDDLKKSWLTKAAEFLEVVAKTILDLADLLLSILVRIASLVWDIVQHPIRFFETLVRGLVKAIDTFISDIGTYLEEAFWSWLTGASAAKSIKLGPGSGVEKLFGLVVQVLSITKEDLKKIAEKVFGKEVVVMVEKGLEIGEKVTAEAKKLLEPAAILMRDGLGAFWEYLKDTMAKMVDGVIKKIKETVFFEFVSRGLKWIAGFFVPGGGFVKVVKALLAAVQFLVNNMERIKVMFDSILDSFEKAVKGDEGGVVARVLVGIKTGIIMALDFLARVLGLDKILDKVQKLFQSLRKPLMQGIEWVLRKVKTALEKIGFFRLLKKAGEVAKKGKEAVVKKGKAAAAAGKKAVGAVLGFFGIRKYFSTNTGERHSLYFEKRGGLTVLLIESTAQDIRKFVDFYASERKLDTNKTQLVSQILSHLESYEEEYAELKKVGETSKKAKPIHERLLQKNVSLGELLRTLLSGDRKVGLLIESYLLEGLTGTYSSMPRPPNDILTPDHQPQAAILKWSADLKVPGSRRKVYSSSSEMANRAGGAHASGGYAINLHEIRHTDGRTFGNKGETTKNDFINFIEPKIASETDDQKIRNTITKRMKKELEWDVTAMRKVLKVDKNWADIDEITDLNKTERQKLKADIKVQITKGLRQIENQPMDSLKDY